MIGEIAPPAENEVLDCYDYFKSLQLRQLEYAESFPESDEEEIDFRFYSIFDTNSRKCSH